jgi:signal transduction histidine kinase
MEERSKLFGKFNRLNRDYSGSIRGSGLGLYICKQYVQTLGGKIWVDSTGIDGQGSRLSLTITAEAPKQSKMDVHSSDIKTSSSVKMSENIV